MTDPYRTPGLRASHVENPILHLRSGPGRVLCGAEIPYQRTTQTLMKVTCATCLQTDLLAKPPGAALAHLRAVEAERAKVRPSWDRYFMDIAEAVSARGTCDRKRVGAVLVAPTSERHAERGKPSPGRILATGYNGALPGLPSCDEVGHDFAETLDARGVPRSNCVRTVHAEMNALASAAYYGVALGEPTAATCYVNTYPCWPCFRALVAAGVRRVVFRDLYNPDPRIEAAAGPIGVVLAKLDPNAS